MLLGNKEGKGKNLAKTGKNGKLLLSGSTIGMERDRWQNYVNKLIFKVNYLDLWNNIGQHVHMLMVPL